MLCFHGGREHQISESPRAKCDGENGGDGACAQSQRAGWRGQALKNERSRGGKGSPEEVGGVVAVDAVGNLRVAWMVISHFEEGQNEGRYEECG